MSLTLYFHPLSSYCQKVLIALYEIGTPFDTHLLVDLTDPVEAAAYMRDWRKNRARERNRAVRKARR